MDMVKTGAFLKELRKEQGLTQEQLGSRLGVTNKTVSRWETGNYMPPVDCLAAMSELYGLSMNELVAGRRLSEREFPQAAEDNLSTALELSENALGRTEKGLTATLVISTLMAIGLIMLIPFDSGHWVRGVLMLLLTVALAFVSNTVIIVALVLNKERGKRK